VSSSLTSRRCWRPSIARAVRLADADSGTLYEFDEPTGYSIRDANFGVSDEMIETLRGCASAGGRQWACGAVTARQFR